MEDFDATVNRLNCKVPPGYVVCLCGVMAAQILPNAPSGTVEVCSGCWHEDCECKRVRAKER